MAPGILATPEYGNTNVTNGDATSTYKRRAKVDEPQRALALIEEYLPKMAPLNAILKLDIGLESGPLYLDARSEPVLTSSHQEEPACNVKIKPEYIKQFVEGKLEPRHGLFKDGFFDETTLPKGDIKVAVKFADYLCPVDRINLPPAPSPEKLPKPTQDIEQVLSDVKEWGYGLVSNALTPAEVSTLRSAIRQQASGEIAAGVSKHDGGPNAVNQRIWTLINKGPEFHSLLEHPLIDDIVPEMLGDYFLIHSYSANIARPGNVPMMVHTDQVGIQPPVRNMYYGLNIMWFLEDVTEENGGTRVWPGSHLGNYAPDDPFSIEGSIAAEGPAGTALVFESRLWHATGPNRLSEGERPVILMFFMRSFVRQQENNFLSILPEVEASMSDKVRRMLGFVTNGAFGGVEGEVREGTYVKRLENPVGMFRDSLQHSPFRQGVRSSS
ncbi:Dioxygenase [Pseudocercospora fuligena]|uniref:Dioxygenase n=1 Tax=Pseudocercospora fuligena TaxID=685502 RepID=A0A8H6RPY5_9PEZI|nr:Dioxygenase [Pseudocercospora fuligena]